MTHPGPGGHWQPPQGTPRHHGGFPPPGPADGSPPPSSQYPQSPQYPQHPQQPQHPPNAQYPAGGPQQAYPAQQYPPPFPPPQQPGVAYAGPAAPEPPRRGRRGLVIALVAVLVAVLGGGATWFALSRGDSVAAGADTPDEAAARLATALGDGDVVGLLSALAPAEAAVLVDPVSDTTAELKRLGVLDESADPESLSGLRISTEGLRFDEAQAEQVNDHLTITKLTGGTLTIDVDLARLPLAGDFLDAVLSADERRALEGARRSRTVDVADLVREAGEPIRIATVRVDGEWYPSLFYTVADYALRDAGEPWPQQSIPAVGADSPNDAVRALVQAALDADPRRVIELLPPDEMAVLHDAGPALVAAAGQDLEPAGAEIVRLETETSEVTGGTRATLTELELRQAGGPGTFSLVRDGDCYRVTVDGDSQQVCADQFGVLVARESDTPFPPEARQALQSFGTGLVRQGLGVVTTEVDGKHYVSPLRTLNEVGLTVLRSFDREDLLTLLRAAAG
ncbi:hypothetical protein B0I33_110215 [Prauserella shujinwangii]|uniref:Flagellar basal body-associated protein FliL n=1 Tax=Prauserella shujinwangii TaxID=1453103 RepID=A0A2T0LPM1_9PSEU|nr:flagellar basal body protein FliL [Prauserella shujinwangii]PRX45116.1 hypothetical protein B0I33_110215 [Prauserella shujinwangii]